MNLIAGCIHWIDEKKDAGRVKEAVAGMKGDPGMSLEKNALWFGIGQNQFNILQLRLSLVARLFYSRFQCFALHVGFLRMSGRQLNSTDVIHWRILSFLGAQLDVSAPRVASLRALYPRRPTLHEHQRLAKALLGFRKMTEPVRRQLVGHLRQTRGSASEPAELLINARQWLYEHRYLIGSERELLDTCRAVLVDHKSKLVKEIGKLIPLRQRKRWVAELSKIRPELGDRTYLEWLRQSPRHCHIER